MKQALIRSCFLIPAESLIAKGNRDMRCGGASVDMTNVDGISLYHQRVLSTSVTVEPFLQYQ